MTSAFRYGSAVLDHILAIVLLLVIPIRALWRSRAGRIASGTKITRYITTIGMVVGMLAFLAADWRMTGRSASALGLDAPTSTPALIGLGIAAALLAALMLGSGKQPAPAQSDVDAARRELLPETPGEMRLFPLVCLAAGCGWEILYRGFLLLYLQPVTGLWGAVILASSAYGAAHGFKGVQPFAASILSALAFTIGYVATASLWWLMLLHTSLMILGALTSRALSRDVERG